MVIIPAIDIIDGQCVRLVKGDYGKKTVYGSDPVAVAKEFERHGIMRLHLVDLDGARAGHIVNAKVLASIAEQTDLIIDFGGGVKRDEDIELAFSCGAAMVTGGSIAVKDPERMCTWLDRWGAERIILGADTKDGRIAVQGWTEVADHGVEEFILTYLRKGIRKVICTDISKDGMMGGASLDLYRDLHRSAVEAGFSGLELIASGGVSSLEELDLLAQAGLSGAIVGKAIYEGTIKLDELAAWVSAHPIA